MTHTRRQSRGYSHEHKIVLDVNKIDGWFCRRLGGSSANLPDIIATNNQKSRLIVAEFKSLTPKLLKNSKELMNTYAVVPQDQAERCVEIARMFSVYKTIEIVFAFKFSNSATHKPIHYYFVVPPSLWGILLDKTAKVKCTTNGTCWITTMDGSFTLESRPYFL